MNIPGQIANATNRVNVLASSSVSALTFQRNGLLGFNLGKWIILTVVAGAVIGILMALELDDQQFRTAYKYILIPILFILLIKPQKFINPDQTTKVKSKWITIPIYFLMGIYAGFIQVGFGVIFLLVIVMLDKYDLIKANALKVLVIACYTLVAIFIFNYRGWIRWEAGLLIAIGQAFGGYLAARYASRVESANKYAYYLIITIVVIVIIKNFELWKLF